jgi:NAD(P)-dependent dehydrogenase (short-subunit alcohol dehydrogenase family)
VINKNDETRKLEGHDSRVSPSAVIFSASSDIGTALAWRWIKQGFHVAGTYRTLSDHVTALKSAGADLTGCDLVDPTEIDKVASRFSNIQFSRVVLAAGTQEPIGLFADVNFDRWVESFEINFLGQLRFLHSLLQNEGLRDSRVLFFAGGGTNNATQRYSAYTIAKIASIKIVELLATEYPRTSFSIIGPGWVKTKIHKATLDEPLQAGQNFETTLEHFRTNDFFSMEELMECIDWIFEESSDLVSGRNFSAVHDDWGSSSLRRALKSNPDLYKLRRFGNEKNFDAQGGN